MIYSTIAQVSLVTLLCVTVFAAMVEDRVVRLSALLHALNWVLVAALQRRHEHHVFQTADFLIDTVGAVLACVIAARAEKAWAGALAACQVLGALNYLLPLIDPAILHRASVTASYIWEAGSLSALTYGAYRVVWSSPSGRAATAVSAAASNQRSG